MTGIAAAKRAARAEAEARRALAHAAADGGRGAATEHLLAALAPYRGRVVSGYLPIRSEIDPLPAMTALAAEGPVAVPEIVAKGEPLRFRRWLPGVALVRGPFGISLPVDAEVVEPEALIVPLLAFDRLGYRLGYGGGYYDRTLAALRAKGRILAIGFAHAGQEVAALPVEPTDMRLDAVATEAGVRRWS